jgi:hypothetical protein
MVSAAVKVIIFLPRPRGGGASNPTQIGERGLPHGWSVALNLFEETAAVPSRLLSCQDVLFSYALEADASPLVPLRFDP